MKSQFLTLAFITAPMMLVVGVSVEFAADFFSNTTLSCDARLLNLPQYTVYKKYWILPNGTDIQWNHEAGNTSRYTVSPFPEFNLSISHVTDEDYGWYRCVILWDDYIFLIHTINVGLNSDGTLFNDIFEEYKQNFFIGLIVAGGTAILIGSLCLFYWCRYSDTNRLNDAKDFDDVKTTKKNKKKKADVKRESDISTVAGIEEKEVIYALNKAVKGYDDEEEEAEISGGTVVLTVAKEIYAEPKMETSSTESKDEPIDNEPNNEANQKSNIAAADDDYGDDNIAPPTPPPLPPPPLNFGIFPEEEGDEENAADSVIYLNRAYDADDGANGPTEYENQIKDKEYVRSDSNFSDFDNNSSDRKKSFSFQEELVARLMSHGLVIDGIAEDDKENDDNDIERIRF